MSYGIFVSFRFVYLWMGLCVLLGWFIVVVVGFRDNLRLQKTERKKTKQKQHAEESGCFREEKNEASTKWKYVIAKRKYFALKWISEECCHVGKCLLQTRGDEEATKKKECDRKKPSQRTNEWTKHKVIAKWNGAFEFKILQSLPNLNFNLTC